MAEDEADLLTIPSFLRRPKKRGRKKAPVKEQSNPPAPSSSGAPPPGYKQYHIFNSDIRFLGSGYRMVWAKIGRKWTFIWRGEGHNRIRVRCSVFQAAITSPRAQIATPKVETPNS